MAVNASSYFAANPDVAASFASNNYGLTKQQFADFHYENYGQSENRLLTGNAVNTSVVLPATSAVTLPTTATAKATTATSLPVTLPVVNTSVSANTGDNVSKLTNQILAQGTTAKWTGQGKGSVQANANDMAKMLASADITDINQFGKVALYEPVQEIGKTFNGQNVSLGYDAKTGTQTYGTYTGALQTDGEGNSYNAFVSVPQNAKLETAYGIVRDGGESGGYLEPVDTSKLKTVNGKLSADTGGTTFGNILTGKNIANNYETGSNAFGGTSDGKGNTGYRVEFDATGKPLFYTTGASSSDVPKWVKPALIIAGAYFGLDAAGLLGGLGGTTAAGLTAAEAAGLGLTAAEAASLGLSATEFAAAAGTAGTGLLGSGSLTAGLTAADIAALEYGLPGLTSTQLAALTTGGVSTVAGMGGVGGLTTGAGGITGLTTGAGGVTGLTTAGGLTGANTLLGGTLGSTLGGLTTGVVGSTLGSTVGSTLGSTVGSTLGSTLANTAATGLGGLTAAQLGALISGGLNTGAGLLQQQTSREAAIAAQAMIDRETAAAKQAAQFRPVGMTTRFGTSQFVVDPVTGRLTSAGYTLTPEAKAQQDRLVALSNAGLTQAEGAQAQFAPLQTAAQSLYGLGQGFLNAQNDPRLAQIASQYLAQSPESKMLTSLGGKYIAQSPQEVAQNYLNQQMALLQPGREQELANLQNRLQQQGRGGLSVAQGGTLGATTPELQALYNARAQQEAQLAANAQQAGQQQVQFGAGLVGTGQQLGIQGQQFGMDTLARQQALEQQRLAFGSGLFNQGAGLMGQYYAGQQAAYAPYTTAMGQVQNLEQLGQQPLMLGAQLGQQAATAGARAGEAGLYGAKLSTALATSPAATTNPYSTLLGGLGASPTFGTLAGSAFGSLFS